jgi:excisionase family DNA binding protein
MNTKTALLGLDPLLSVGDLAEYLGVPITTVYDWRSNGLGPVGYRIGKHIKFAVPDVREWLAAQRDQRPAANAAAMSQGSGGE